MEDKSKVVGLTKVSISNSLRLVFESPVDEYDNFSIDIDEWDEIKATVDKMISEVQANEVNSATTR
ncbi:hypothetical protein H0262_05495 [Psychrobacter cryohalolentis]|uniref:hypothetical protein n=1 Tax=Psychrobacter sp. D2 TaxID=2759702 RepID=UPI0015E5D026|nr:hypothetical protein [Psychrobacter sp. D2]MBA2057335.1 hypothetical protein [Psychrobacter sp. D2]